MAWEFCGDVNVLELQHALLGTTGNLLLMAYSTASVGAWQGRRYSRTPYNRIPWYSQTPKLPSSTAPMPSPVLNLGQLALQSRHQVPRGQLL